MDGDHDELSQSSLTTSSSVLDASRLPPSSPIPPNDGSGVLDNTVTISCLCAVETLKAIKLLQASSISKHTFQATLHVDNRRDSGGMIAMTCSLQHYKATKKNLSKTVRNYIDHCQLLSPDSDQLLLFICPAGATSMSAVLPLAKQYKAICLQGGDQNISVIAESGRLPGGMDLNELIGSLKAFLAGAQEESCGRSDTHVGWRNSFAFGTTAWAVLHAWGSGSLLLDFRQHDVNEQDSHDGNSALHMAASRGMVECARALISAGANMALTNKEDKTPLAVACELGREAVIHCIVQASRAEQCAAAMTWDGRRHVLTSVAEGAVNNSNKRLAAMTALLRGGVRVEEIRDGTSALHTAASTQWSEGVRQLLQFGSSVELRDHNQRTPLHCAAAAGALECIRLLLAQGAPPNSRDGKGHTPLHEAVSTSAGVVLVSHGARTNVMSRDGQRIDNMCFRQADGVEAVIDAERSWQEMSTVATVEILGCADFAPDSSSKECLLCSDPFTLFNRRHHCRRCGTLVCNMCSKKKAFEQSSTGSEKNSMHRVCDGCFNVLRHRAAMRATKAQSKSVVARSATMDTPNDDCEDAEFEDGGLLEEDESPTAPANNEEAHNSERGAIAAGLTQSDGPANVRSFGRTPEADTATSKPSAAAKAEADWLREMESAKSTMAETEILRAQMQNRGRRLSSLADKAQALEDASRKFGAMSSLLKTKSK